MEKQQTATKDEKKLMLSRIRECDQCRPQFLADGTLAPNESQSPITNGVDLESAAKCAAQEEHIRQLELELAQTKLALVETQCRSQDLTHQLNSAQTELQERKTTWLNKTLTQIKTVTAQSTQVMRKEGSRDSVQSPRD